MQYLYESGDEAVLMDFGDYEQISLPRSSSAMRSTGSFPNDEVDVLFVDERPADVQVPSAVEMTVTQTDPGVRGDTASGEAPSRRRSSPASRCRSALRERGRPGAGRHAHARVRRARLGIDGSADAPHRSASCRRLHLLPA